MNKKIFKIVFQGRQRGAIGKFQNFKVEIVAENKEKAILKLYENYEHISCPFIKEINKD